MTNGSSEFEALKARLKATWMAGDFGKFAQFQEAGAEEFVARLELSVGIHVLDVACGSGNLAIPAARTGAIVTGVDIATNLLEQGRARAQAEGLSIQFDEGDAENLPYDDATFDIVATLFGAMFAPRPAIVAAELVRVCRPNGRIVMANWTPTGFVGQSLKATAAHVPPPPGFPPPVLWGDEANVRERLQEGISDLRLVRRFTPLKYPFSVSEVVEFHRLYLGPTQRAFYTLNAEGQAALRHDMERLWSEHNQATDGTTHVEAEYLEVIATRA